jgi:hypothetical protein
MALGESRVVACPCNPRRWTARLDEPAAVEYADHTAAISDCHWLTISPAVAPAAAGTIG